MERYFPVLRKLFALGGLGLGCLGILLIILSYVAFAPQLASLSKTTDSHISHLDGMLATLESSSMNLSMALRESSSGGLGTINEALLAYADSSDKLASSLETTDPSIFPDAGEAAKGLRTSARKMRTASSEIDSLSASLNSTASDLEALSMQMNDYRDELASSRLTISLTFGAISSAYLLFALAAIVGLLSLMALSVALLLDTY